jgi:hypothetical protein
MPKHCFLFLPRRDYQVAGFDGICLRQIKAKNWLASAPVNDYLQSAWPQMAFLPLPLSESSRVADCLQSSVFIPNVDTSQPKPDQGGEAAKPMWAKRKKRAGRLRLKQWIELLECDNCEG